VVLAPTAPAPSRQPPRQLGCSARRLAPRSQARDEAGPGDEGQLSADSRRRRHPRGARVGPRGDRRHAWKLQWTGPARGSPSGKALNRAQKNVTREGIPDLGIQRESPSGRYSSRPASSGVPGRVIRSWVSTPRRVSGMLVGSCGRLMLGGVPGALEAPGAATARCIPEPTTAGEYGAG